MIKKITLLALASALTIASTSAAYETVDCSTNPIFWQNSCIECFNWWELKSWDTLSFLDDAWNNNGQNDALSYKEEIVMPKMISTPWAEFTQKPSSDAEFWETTEDLEKLYSESYGWYVLPAWQSVTWIRSTLWSAFMFNNKSLNVWDTAWVLTFDLSSHSISETWDVVMNEKPHRECVAYTNWSWIAPVTPEPLPTPEPTPEEMTQVKTWPGEMMIVALLSILLAVALINRRLVLARVKK